MKRRSSASRKQLKRAPGWWLLAGALIGLFNGGFASSAGGVGFGSGAATGVIPADGGSSECPCASGVEIPQSVFRSVNADALLADARPLGTKVGEPPKSSKTEAGDRDLEEAKASGLRVLILGDSLSLCGFGKTLDEKFRKDPGVSAVFTYMACGSVPTSWLRTGPYAHARTACGFWSIEGEAGKPPEELKDTYGMGQGYRPQPHVIPKIENLLEVVRPDILVMQNGTNLLSLFADGKTLIPSRHDAQIKSYITPFLRQLAEKAPSLKRVFWVAPPVSGRVSEEIQDFLVKRIESYSCGFLKSFDSRNLIKFPYKNMMPDKEHFIGRDMEVWAEGIYKMVREETSGEVLQRSADAKSELLKGPKKESLRGVAEGDRKQLAVRATLIAKSPPLKPEQMAPYHESMVGYLYKIDRLESGETSEGEVLVMHPAHINLKAEPLDKYVIGRSYRLNLVEFEGSAWEAIKRSEATGRIELLPYIRREDDVRFPSLHH